MNIHENRNVSICMYWSLCRRCNIQNCMIIHRVRDRRIKKKNVLERQTKNDDKTRGPTKKILEDYILYSAHSSGSLSLPSNLPLKVPSAADSGQLRTRGRFLPSLKSYQWPIPSPTGCPKTCLHGVCCPLIRNIPGTYKYYMYYWRVLQ